MNSEPGNDPSITETLRQLAEAFRILASKSTENNRQTSRDFNTFRLLPQSETDHSRILGELLNPNGDHGQGTAFLSTFLKALEIDFTEGDHWIVSVGAGFVDVVIKRLSPHSVIIVENKCCYAIDQLNQLYRYWYQEIYLPRQTSPAMKAEVKDDRIVYLSPSREKKPEHQSLSRPDYLHQGNPSLKEPMMPLKVWHWVVNEDVVKWLEASLSNIARGNYRMIEFVTQYIEFWRSPMSSEFVNHATAVFDSPEKWDAYLEFVDAKGAIQNKWVEVLNEALQKRLAQSDIVPRWAWSRDGVAIRWYLEEFAVNPIGLCFRYFNGHFVLALDTTSSSQSVNTLISGLLREAKFSGLRSGFERIDQEGKPGTWMLEEWINFRFGNPHDNPPKYDGQEWFAGNKTEEFVNQIVEKVDRFRRNDVMTGLLRKLNQECQKSLPGEAGA